MLVVTSSIDLPWVPALAVRHQPRPVPLTERVLLLIMVIGIAALWALSAVLEREVAWAALGARMYLGGTLMCLGLVLRTLTAWNRLPTTLVALGFFQCFLLLTLSCTYLRFPFPDGTIDPVLARIDAALGYVWAEATVALVAVPGAGPVLARVYGSSLMQILALVLLLGLLRRVTELHRLTLCSAISAVVTVLIWCAFPSLGPAAFATVSLEVEANLDLVASAKFGEQFRLFAEQGAAVISPNVLTGVIALPSYHAIMALLVVCYSRQTWAFHPALALNLLMVPATLVHGGHHLVDLIGGAAVFALSAVLAARLAPRERFPEARL